MLNFFRSLCRRNPPPPAPAPVPQDIFDGGQRTAVAEALRLMQYTSWRGGRKTLRELLTYLAAQRRIVADKQHDAHAPDFGKLRVPDARETAILAMPAETTRERLLAQTAASSKTEVAPKYSSDVYGSERAHVADTLRNHGRLRSASIVIVEGVARGYHMKTPAGTRVTGTGSAGLLDGEMTWAHTPPSLIGVVLQEAEQFHNTLLTGDQSLKLRALAMVTWHVTNAMPYSRGSSAVVEWYNLAAIAAFNLDLPPRAGWLDLPAFRIDANTYADNYRNIYAGRFHGYPDPAEPE